MLPTIGNGMDICAIIGTMMPDMLKTLDVLRVGDESGQIDKDQMNAKLALLPDKPDETLR